MIIKKVFICIVSFLFVFSSCEKGQLENVGDSQSGVQQEAVDETGEVEEDALAIYEREEAEREAAKKAEAEKEAAEKAAAAIIKQKYGNVIKTASIEELINNFDFYLSFYSGITIYNEKGKWHCEFEFEDVDTYFISHEVFDDSLIVYVSIKDNNESDFFVKYKITIPRTDIINSIYKDCYYYSDAKEYFPESEDKFSVEIPAVKDVDRYFITDSKIDNGDDYNNKNVCNKNVCNEDIEKLFADTVWISSNKGNQKYRDFNSCILKLADGGKYLIFDKYNDDIIVYYGYSDFPGEYPVYDHFAGRVCGVDCLEGEYTFYLNPITNIEVLIQDCFVEDVSNAVYGSDIFAITFKQGADEDESEDRSEENPYVKYISFDENFESGECKFVEYKNADFLEENSARILGKYVPVFSSEFVSDPKIAVLSEGDVVKLLYKSQIAGENYKDEDCWYYCQVRDGRCGWIFGEFVDCPNLDKLPVKEYTVHEVNTYKEFPIEYRDFFIHMFVIYEGERLGYPPVKERIGYFNVYDNKFLSKEFDGKIYIGMDKSELIELMGEPVREIDEFTIEYCQEHLSNNICGGYWYFGSFHFTADDKVDSIKVCCNICH